MPVSNDQSQQQVQDAVQQQILAEMQNQAGGGQASDSAIGQVASSALSTAGGGTPYDQYIAQTQGQIGASLQAQAAIAAITTEAGFISNTIKAVQDFALNAARGISEGAQKATQ